MKDVLELAADLFAALGAFVVILATLGYMWGYFG
jgi:hypothetical protein